MKTKETTVSTHSRPKAAGYVIDKGDTILIVSTHSRPKAAGQSQCSCYYLDKVSTHSRPKAAGKSEMHRPKTGRGFNTQPPEGGWS